MSRAYEVDTLPRPSPGLLRAVARRFANAGVTYNTGNWLAISASALQVAVSSRGDVAETARGFAHAFIGGGPAVAVTLGSLIFFVGGRSYDLAWAHGAPPDRARINAGHFWSALGALFLAAGLVGLAQTAVAHFTALAAGLLHVGGKSGSLLDPRRDRVYKILPLLSRAPVIVSLLVDLGATLARGADERAILPILLLCANLVWARADGALMAEGRVKALLRPLLRL